jgi:hypothetical protein
MKRLEHPYNDLTGGQWVRGNLHTHTDRSDGQRPPQAVIDDYAARKYDFLMVSDHDQFTDPDQFESRGMVMICGNEISANGPHLLHVNVRRAVAPDADRRRLIAEESAADDGSFIIANHPNWQVSFDHCTIAQLREWSGCAGIEIFNGVIGRLDGSPYATNKWDMLLAGGRRIWGFANDDSHASVGDVALGWNMAFVRERTAEGVLDALRRGRFYASTGVTITDIQVTDRRIRIQTADAERIVALQQTGKRFAVADASSMEVEVPENASYVRFECWGRGERFAWTQPFFSGNE